MSAVTVPSALVLSPEHRKLFLSTLVLLITGQSVRAGQTDPAIMFTVLDLMRSWLLSTKPSQLTQKEFLVLVQRLAQVERMHAIPPSLKPSWDRKFLDLLYRVIVTKKEDDFGNEVFNRVERTFCCGLQSSDPEVRHKVGFHITAAYIAIVLPNLTYCSTIYLQFFRLYAERIPRDLFDRLRYIIQIQDWDFLAHTFWLKHAVVSSY